MSDNAEMNEEMKLVPSAGADTHSSAGRMLAKAREDMGIEVEKIADRLHLSVDVIRAIESGRKEGVPPRPFLQGHIRSYAKLVNLDINIVLPLWEKEYPPIVVEKIVPTQSDKRIRRMHRGNRRIARRKGSRKKFWLIAFFLLLVLVIGFGLLSTFDKNSSPLNNLRSRLPASQPSSDLAEKNESSLTIPLAPQPPPSQFDGT